MLIAVAGKFDIDLLTGAACQVSRGAEPQRKLTSWGLAYCYGNRLEAAKTSVEAKQGHGFEKLVDVRTDMAVMTLGLSGTDEAGILQPLLRKEKKQMWAFCAGPSLPPPGALDPGRLRPEGESTLELLFLHVLSRFKPDDPIKSVRKSLEGLGAEQGINCFLLNADVLVVARWAGTAPPEVEDEIWLGQGPLLRLFAPAPLRELERVEWAKLEDRTVMAVSRLRRPIG